MPFPNTEVVILLKYLSTLGRPLDLTLIKSDIDLDLSWLRNCVLSEDDDNISSTSFQINSARFYVPVVTLVYKQ